MKAFLWLVLVALALAGEASAQSWQTGVVAPSLAGTGSPTIPCNVTTANITYIQTDATSGRVWLCDMASGSWAWDHLLSPVAVGNTGSIGGSAIVGIGCATGTVTIPLAVQGINVAIAVAVTNPGLVNGVLPPLVAATVGTAGVITVSVCNPTSLVSFTPTASVYRVFVY